MTQLIVTMSSTTCVIPHDTSFHPHAPTLLTSSLHYSRSCLEFSLWLERSCSLLRSTRSWLPSSPSSVCTSGTSWSLKSATQLGRSVSMWAGQLLDCSSSSRRHSCLLPPLLPPPPPPSKTQKGTFVPFCSPVNSPPFPSVTDEEFCYIQNWP